MENSIEEAIKVMEHWIEYEKNNKEKINRADELINIQETILSAYKRVLKEKNRLEEQVEYDKTHIYTPQTIELNFISKSKIEDKIEKLNSESYAEKLEDMMNIKNYTITELVQYVLQELLDGSDTDVGSIGNSIEEDIKILEEFKTNGYSILLMKYGDRIKTNFKLAKAIEHILSNYKRVLKENEILKEEKEQAWEEWNNLEQGSYGTEQKLKQQIKELRKENEELKEERQIVGIPVRNKRDRRIGIVLHQWENGSVAVLESINPRVINTHDSWNTLEIVTDEVKQTPPPEPQLPTKTICESFSKKVRNK